MKLQVAHRKIIVHDDGVVCQRTYNKVCPMVHDDEEGTFDIKSIPMYHEDPTRYYGPEAGKAGVGEDIAILDSGYYLSQVS